MAHFAELDDNNIVLRVMVINNSDITDENNIEQESIGQELCNNLYGGRWIQTSYNGNFRFNYAGIGDTYDIITDAFIRPQPYPSWVLNSSTKLWEAPILYPDNGLMYQWNEESISWDPMTFEVTD